MKKLFLLLIAAALAATGCQSANKNGSQTPAATPTPNGGPPATTPTPETPPNGAPVP